MTILFAQVIAIDELFIFIFTQHQQMADKFVDLLHAQAYCIA